MRFPLSERRSRIRVIVAIALAAALPGIQAPISQLLPSTAVASSDELSSTSYVQLRDQLLGPSPDDGAQAAKQLVAQILGPDETTAQVATIELLRQAGIPTIGVDGAIVAMPSDIVIANGPMIGDFLANMTRSVRAGDYYTIQEIADIFMDSDDATEEIPPDMLLEGITEWGKLPNAPRESIVAGTAVRELGARRGEPLFPGLALEDTRVDVLQFTLLYLHLIGTTMQVDTAGSPPASPNGLVGPAVARAADDCRNFYDALQFKAPNGAPLDDVAAHAIFKQIFFDALAAQNKVATDQVKGALKAVDYASKSANLIVFLTSIQLKLEADKYKTHFRHEPGDTSKDVHAVATASWQQGETAQQLRCLQGLVGIDTQANGPMPGLLVHWRLDEAADAAATGKFLRPKAGQAKQFDGTLNGGDTTDANGQSRVALEPAVESQPGKGSLLKGGATLYASLDKQNMPDILKAFLSAHSGVSDALKLESTIWPKFIFNQIFDISLKAIQRAGMPVRKIPIEVEYHGADAYAIQGVRHPFLIFYTTTIDIDAYTCEGLSGKWQGTVSFTADKSLWALWESTGLVGKAPDSASTSGPFSATLDLRGKSDVLFLTDPFRLKVSVDQSLVDRGKYGTVGEAGVMIQNESLEPFMFFDPSGDLPVIRLSNKHGPGYSNVDELCPGYGSYFP